MAEIKNKQQPHSFKRKLQLLSDEGFLDAEDKKKLEKCFRLQDGTVQEILFPAEGEGPVRLREYDSAGEIAAEEKTR